MIGPGARKALSAVVFGAALSAAALLLPAAALSGPPKAGPYTAEQAAAGARIYAMRCAMCHGADLAGSVEIPALRGRFVAHWAGRPVGNLFDYLSVAMPQNAPGSLTAQDNARLVAFILQANGVPPGNAALPDDPARLQRLTFPAGAR